MKAVLDGHVLAESGDIISAAGYDYFPAAAVHTELLEKSPKTAKDLECPHGVQFYDVVIDGRRHARNAWVYEAPQPRLAHVAGRFGFWQEVKLG
ncbi:MAG TPA: DUF427 domain-containing protein [Xanthobacteraceae bacterium]|jgi:uncharacterized protein (DUF427 family)|nr:DUF427 domain-containing protein [Xanthobacteraceae bacterium]